MKNLLQLFLILSICYSALTQQIGTSSPEVHPTLMTQECTKSGCQTRQTKIVLDANWRWLHNVGGYENCYPAKDSWNPTHCPDGTSCARQCALEGVDYRGTAGVSSSGDSLRLNYVTKTQYGETIGSRVFLVDTDDTNYKMFSLLNKEFTFDVDVSTLSCGLNGALYLVEMKKDGGLSQTNKAGAKYGTGYCDAQCPRDVKYINGQANVNNLAICCNEMDIWEANSMANALSPHPCATVGPQLCNSESDCGDGALRYQSICDKDGCDFNPYRMGNKTFYGKGMIVDTSRTFTIVTQFLTNDGTDSGDLSEIRRYYIQDGKVIPNSEIRITGMGNYDSITDQMCDESKTAFDNPNAFKQRGGLKVMGDAIRRGMVLVLSIWDDAATNMNWLDSSTPKDGGSADAPGVTRGSCERSAGNPTSLRSNNANAYVVYSKVKYGDIGTTTNYKLPGKSSGSNQNTNPLPVNPPSNPTPVNPPSNPIPSNPIPSNPPSNPTPVNPPSNPRPAVPPSNPVSDPPQNSSPSLPAVSLGPNVNPFTSRNYYVNPAYQKDLQSSIQSTTDSTTKETLNKMKNMASAFWVDTISKIDASGSTNTLKYNLNRAAGFNPAPLLVVMVYDLPNRDCAAKASNGEICCYPLPDGRCDYTKTGDCAEGINKYKTQYIDALYKVISQYPSVPLALIIEPDSLPNFVTNLGVPACGNPATQAAYSQGITYAVNKLSQLKNVVIYIDAAHGGWLGWEDGATSFARTIADLGILPKIRGFATNVANYQATGSKVCPSVDHCVAGKNSNDPCCEDPCGLTSQYNKGHNEVNYANFLKSKFAAQGKSDVYFIIDTGRNGATNVRTKCSNWCNIRNAGVGQAPTSQTVAPFIDAFFWLKTPGESDGCTQQLPSGQSCPRFDYMCSSEDSLGSQSGEPRAPEAGTWFDYQIKQLAKNAKLGNIPNPVPLTPVSSDTPRPDMDRPDIPNPPSNPPSFNPPPSNPPPSNPPPFNQPPSNPPPSNPPPFNPPPSNPPPSNPPPSNPPAASSECAGVRSAGQDDNMWYVEIVAPQGSTVQSECGNGEKVSLEYKSWGSYAWTTDGRKTCTQPRTFVVNGKRCRSNAFGDEYSNEQESFEYANAVGEVYNSEQTNENIGESYSSYENSDAYNYATVNVNDPTADLNSANPTVTTTTARQTPVPEWAIALFVLFAVILLALVAVLVLLSRFLRESN